MHTRPSEARDVAAIGAIADATELFPSEMLPDLIGGFLAEGEAEDRWLTCEGDGDVICFLYAVSEQLAEGTRNMLAIGVTPDRQSEGAGTALTERLEADLRDEGARILLADTSGTDAFERTRAFYAKRGYEREARIRDFWVEGDDKVTFRKAL